MANEEWHSEIVITEELVKTCIQEQFPSLTPIQSLKKIGEGWDNQVFLLNDSIVFRFPHRKISVQLIEQENVLLQHLHSMLSLEIPNPQYHGQPNQIYPFPFHGYLIVPGTPGYRANLTFAERSESINPLAHFLKKLHSIDDKLALSLGAKPQVFDRTDFNHIQRTLKERVQKLIERKIGNLDQSTLEYEISQASKLTLPRNDNVLVHGDLYSRHLIFNQGKLTGIIDWGDNGINNRCIDLAVVFSFYPPACHNDFLAIYGPIEENSWQYARFLAIYSALTLLLYAHDIGNNPLFTEAANIIQWVNPKLFNQTNQ